MARSTAQLARTAKNPEEIDAALTVLAYYGGNAARAAQDLGNVSERTLRDWRNHAHRDRYLQIAEREGPRIEALAAAQAREIVIRSADVEHRILDRTAVEIHPSTISQPLLPGSAETNAREPRPAVESPSSSTSAD
jgi:transposase-like protein